MPSGIIVIDKPEGITSFDVVARIRRLYGTKKVGHTGTLDPLASGVLPVLVGRAVKASEFVTSSDKHYIATLLLGVRTDTEDVTGKILSECDTIPSEAELRRAAGEFIGEIMQVPPMYSALKVGGKKLCDLARAGVTVEREARAVTVFSIGIERLSEREYLLDVVCSKGTYIRTLLANIGDRLGCGGTMKTLRRAEAGGFYLSDAVTLDELEGMSAEERERALFPTERAFTGCREVTLADFFSRLAHAGQQIYLSKIGFSADVGERIIMRDKDGFFAFGEVREYEDGFAIKPIKQFSEQ